MAFISIAELDANLVQRNTKDFVDTKKLLCTMNYVDSCCRGHIQETPMKALCMLLLVLLPMQLIRAQDNKVLEKPATADTAEKFASLATNIRKEMDTGGRYEFIKPGDKQMVNADLEIMAALLQKSGSVAAMSDVDRMKLVNAQEHANGLLTHNDNSRLVCERHAPIGSNILQTTCRTYGQLARDRRDTQNFLKDADMNKAINLNRLCPKLPCQGGS